MRVVPEQRERSRMATLGVLLFQEQCMKSAIVAAGAGGHFHRAAGNSRSAMTKQLSLFDPTPSNGRLR